MQLVSVILPTWTSEEFQNVKLHILRWNLWAAWSKF